MSIVGFFFFFKLAHFESLSSEMDPTLAASNAPTGCVGQSNAVTLLRQRSRNAIASEIKIQVIVTKKNL